MRENGHGTVLARSGRVGASTGMTRVLDQTSNPTGLRSDAERPRVPVERFSAPSRPATGFSYLGRGRCTPRPILWTRTPRTRRRVGDTIGSSSRRSLCCGRPQTGRGAFRHPAAEEPGGREMRRLLQALARPDSTVGHGPVPAHGPRRTARPSPEPSLHD